MNYYQEIKKMLSNQEVVAKYLGQPEHSNYTGNWYKSPFRSEKTASFCVSNKKGIHDFGDSQHYDIIGFVSRYYNVSTYDAYKIICNDFGINIGIYNNDEYKELKKRREEEKAAQELLKKWYNQEMQSTCDELMEINKMIKVLKNTFYLKALSILYDRQTELEYYFEILFKANEQTKIFLYTSRR